MKVFRPLCRTAVVLGAFAAFFSLGSWQHQQAVFAAKDAQAAAKGSKAPGKRGASLEDSPLPLPTDPAGLAALIKDNPGEGLAALEKLPPGKEAQALYQKVFAELAKDPAFAQSAAQLALSLAAGPDRVAALAGIRQGWAQSDPESLLKWASKLPADDSNVLTDSLLEVANRTDHPELAAQYLDQIVDTGLRNQTLSNIAMSMSRKDPAATLDWLKDAASARTYDNVARNIIRDYTAKDIQQAAALIAELKPNSSTQNYEITSVATAWGKDDPQAALAWALTLTGNSVISAQNSALSGWAQRDPQAALAYIQGAADPSAFSQAIPSIAQSLAAKDPTDALAFVQSLPEGTLRDTAMNSALVGAAKTDLNGTWTYVLNLPDGQTRNSAMTSVVDAISPNNPAGAAALLLQMPPGPTQTAAANRVASEWVNNSSQPFLDWLNALPEGNVRDAAIVQLDSSSQATKHPSMALTHANSISDPDTRNAQVALVLNNWAVKDPAAALTAAEKANIPDDQRAALIQSLQARQPAK